jgi:hypothetical protein
MITKEQHITQYKTDGDVGQVTKMGISANDTTKLMRFLSSNIYSDKPGSIIREWTSNGVDSSVESKNGSPVLVCLKQNNNQWQFTVEDTGLGLSKWEVDNVISQYLKSTKETSDELLGCKGIGFKSGTSYQPFFQFRCRKDGVEGLYIMRKAEPENIIECLYEIPTTEPNGVKMILDVNWEDRSEFSRKMRTQLVYFANVFIDDEYSKFDNTYKIYQNELFSYSSICSDKKLHINFGGVYYPLDFNALEIDDIYLPFAINISLTDGVIPVLSRESLEYPTETKILLKDRIQKIQDWCITEYNKNKKQFKSFIEAKPTIDSRYKYISLNGQDIDVSDVKSDIPFLNVTVEGYNSKYLKHLSDCCSSITDRYDCIATIKYGSKFSTKSVYGRISNLNTNILVDRLPTGKLVDYLKEKHAYSSYIFKFDDTPVVLWMKDHKGEIKNTNEAHKYTWYHILDLEDIPKEDWGALIEDAQRLEKEYVAKCIDYRNFEIPKEWLEARKVRYKSEGKLLNKQQGEITYYTTRNKEYGGRMFDKGTKDISKLGKEHRLVLYFAPEDKERALYWDSIFDNLKVKKYNNVSVVLINSREQKYVKHLQNYKNEKEFMETNKFKKLATKLKAEKVKKQYSTILDSAEFSAIIETLRQNKKDVIERIQTYIYDVSGSVAEYTVNDMLKICEENNLWDMSIMSDIKEMEKLTKEFEFLQFLRIPSRYTNDEEGKKVFAKHVAQYILFNKLYKNDFEQFEICVKAPLEETFINEGELIPEEILEMV